MDHPVFVYGTLRSGFGNNRLLASAEDHGRARYVGPAYTSAPATLVDVNGHFPAIVDLDAGPSLVFGEVWEVDGLTLARLDALEGVPSLYTREPVRVVVQGGERDVETYVFASDRRGMRVIESGDFADVARPRRPL